MVNSYPYCIYLVSRPAACTECPCARPVLSKNEILCNITQSKILFPYTRPDGCPINKTDEKPAMPYPRSNSRVNKAHIVIVKNKHVVQDNGADFL